MIEKRSENEIKHWLFADKQRLKLAFMRAIILCLVSLLLAGIFISVVNDMYAFVKPDADVELYLPEGSSVSEISDILGKEGVVNNPFIFTLYVKSKEREDELSRVSGELTLNSGMSYREILTALLKKAPSTE